MAIKNLFTMLVFSKSRDITDESILHAINDPNFVPGRKFVEDLDGKRKRSLPSYGMMLKGLNPNDIPELTEVQESNIIAVSEKAHLLGYHGSAIGLSLKYILAGRPDINIEGRIVSYKDGI